MFPKRQRLSRRRDIDKVRKTGWRYMHPTMTLRVVPTKFGYTRSTVVVGTVVDKRATVRNRVKRQVRHMLIEEFKALDKNTASFDIMVTLRPAIIKQTRPERLNVLRSLLMKANIVKK